MDNCIPETNPSEDVATLLRQQLEDCHEAVRHIFKRVREDKCSRFEMTLSPRLIQASASLATAIRRLEASHKDPAATSAG